MLLLGFLVPPPRAAGVALVLLLSPLPVDVLSIGLCRHVSMFSTTCLPHLLHHSNSACTQMTPHFFVVEVR